ncbi:unnamed protein product [Meloidogyne enterolobii]|uniref:Uncharacterized protein n=3 Tax=Meloidogyne enterolobii TaxID=390850 RepID=A0A6V7Y033_MELEN|nr:unnamed protein product [Meloidogyne enterolobii]CAD2204980.1 unnamed protein product [Meloidogyne enterolobii]
MFNQNLFDVCRTPSYGCNNGETIGECYNDVLGRFAVEVILPGNL